MLRDLDLLQVYDSAEHNLVKDLMVPLLTQSQEYYRGVGYFTSGWLSVAVEGITALISNGGHAKFVVSPLLQREDWECLQLGTEARNNDALKKLLYAGIENIQNSLKADTRNCLAWLVADGLLEFKFAVARDQTTWGDYHDKVGFFTDTQRDTVAIHGSFNDSIKGTLNGEAFSVFCSWIEGQQPFVQEHVNRLRKLWAEGNSQFEVYEIPEAIKEHFISLRTSPDRPYTAPQYTQTTNVRISIPAPKLPFTLHGYQQEAIDAWETANNQGIFEMATGTGKTITSLAAAEAQFQKNNKLALVVLVPYLHLVDQWAQNCKQFGFQPILCSSAHANWRLKATSAIQDYKLGSLKHICLIAVHATASSASFLRITSSLPSETTLMIADETHALGTQHLRAALFPEASMRLGLSATPRRWYDDEGTRHLFSYFNGVCYEYTLEQAIDRFLVPYEYHPIPISLTEEENEQYESISNRIAVLSARDTERSSSRQQIEHLLRQRAAIIASAESKLPSLIQHIQQLINNSQPDEVRDILVYCAPGSHREVLSELARLKLRCHEFVHEVSLPQREKVLKQFADGDIQVLVAIKCLDEGVDVPSTKHAFFLASTTNPREFVQRRGRVLRRAPGKPQAWLYDYIVLPSTDRAHLKKEVDRSLIRREMPRFAEFSSAALNEYEARSIVRPLLDEYEVLPLLEKKPWDIYHELQITGDL